MIRLAGSSLVIVGGGSGLGWASAELAIRLGARVVVADIAPETAARVAGLGAAAGFFTCDARSPEQAAELFETVVAKHGGVDGVLTTVGGARPGSLEDLSLETWKAELDFNLTTAYVVCRAALPALRQRGGGAIVTTSSGYAVLPGPDRMAYSAAKAGVIAFTRSFAAAAASSKVRANCIAPGPIDTPRFRAMNGGDEGVERVRKSMPLGTIPLPVDIANMAMFLLSDAAAQITGQVIHVNGGLLMP
ncbi:MAG: SDR family NAD(P)-dependent oxidoreductase [Steroidobacteraceae bacterium]